MKKCKYCGEWFSGDNNDCPSCGTRDAAMTRDERMHEIAEMAEDGREEAEWREKMWYEAIDAAIEAESDATTEGPGRGPEGV